MKRKNRWFLTVVFIAVALFSNGQNIYAEWIVQNFVDGFNAMNGGSGFKFTSRVSSSADDASSPLGAVVLTPSGDFNQYDEFLSAYKNSEFITFCVQPGLPIRKNDDGYNWGKLSYKDGETFSYMNDPNGTKYSLSVGAAYLYKAFITGEMDTALANGKFEVKDIGMAIRSLMYSSPDWATDPVLKWLLNLRIEVDGKPASQNYWESTTYKLTDSYEFMDEYCVFVLNVYYDPQNENMRSQDFLYITKDHAPEPATILVWTLGTIGIVGYARRRSRLCKQTR